MPWSVSSNLHPIEHLCDEIQRRLSEEQNASTEAELGPILLWDLCSYSRGIYQLPHPFNVQEMCCRKQRQ